MPSLVHAGKICVGIRYIPPASAPAFLFLPHGHGEYGAFGANSSETGIQQRGVNDRQRSKARAGVPKSGPTRVRFMVDAFIRMSCRLRCCRTTRPEQSRWLG